MPRYSDLAIFVATTTDRQTDEQIALPLAHARGVIIVTKQGVGRANRAPLLVHIIYIVCGVIISVRRELNFERVR